MKKITRNMSMIVLIFISTNFVKAQWTQTNGPYGANVYSLAVNSNGHIFAGSFLGGVFRSTDNGGNWTHVGLTTTTVRALAINSSGHIFAGAYYPGGVFRSTDNGGTWAQVNTGLTNTTIYALAASGTNLFAGTWGGGVFRSTDNGESWTQVNTGLTNTYVYTFVVSGANLFVGTRSGVFFSTNNGINWTALNFGLTNTYVHSLTVSGTNLFAGTGGGVFLSTNNGTNWTAVNFGLTSTGISSLAVIGTNLFAGTSDGVFLSTNNGTSWTQVNFGLTNTNVYALAASGTNLFTGTDDGIFRSINNGTSWIQVNNNLIGTQVNALAINSNGNIFAGIMGGGIFRSIDSGASWTQKNSGLTNTMVSVNCLAINSNGNIFVGTYGGGVYRSINNGESWTQINTGLSSTMVNSLTIKSNGNIFVGTNGGVFRSTDNGGSWTSVNSSLTNIVYSFTITSNGYIFAGTYGDGVYRSTDNSGSWIKVGLTNNNVVALTTNSNGYIFAGTDGGGVFRSTDDGGSWVSVNSGLTNTTVWSLVVSGTNLFAGTYGDGVFRSSDNGGSWTQINTGLTNLSIQCFAINSSGYLFTGTNGGGVYQSWQPSTSSQFTQQGNKLVGTGAVGNASQGNSVAISSDGNTAIVGGHTDNNGQGAAWIFTRSGEAWTQQGNKLVGSGSVGRAYQGISVSISADGNTAIVGGPGDGNGFGAVWIFTRSGGVWTQQGNKLIGTGAAGTANQGNSVSISADGNTAIVGGPGYDFGAAWIFTRSGGVWTQQGNKLVGTGAIGNAYQGSSVSISSDGNTVIIGGSVDNNGQGAAWIFARSGEVWTQQGNKLVGNDGIGMSRQGSSVSLSSDGNTVIVAGPSDNNYQGATWIYTRSIGVWTQQGNKLVSTGAVGNANQGSSISLSSDGNTAIVGGPSDNNNQGAVWIYKRKSGIWTQHSSKLVGTGAVGNANQGWSVAISADGNTVIIGGLLDNNNQGAAWIFTNQSSPTSVHENNTSMFPTGFSLQQNYPNPFNPSTIISWQLAVDSYVTLKIYDSLGREVATLVNEFQRAGVYNSQFSIRNTQLSSGVYFYQLQAGNFVETKKLVLLK